MKFLLTFLSSRLRATAFRLASRGAARLLSALLASRLRPAASTGRRPVGDRQVIDGEFRRLQNDRH